MSKPAPTVEIREAFPFSTRDYDVAYSSAPIVFELPAQPGAYVRLNEVDFVTSMEVTATFTVLTQAVKNGCTDAVRGGTVGDYTQYSFRHLQGLTGYFDRIRISTATGVILEEIDGVAYAAAMRAAFLRSSEIDQQARMEGTCVETNPNAFVVYKAGPITTPCGYTNIYSNTVDPPTDNESFKVTQSVEARFRFSSLPSTIMAETVMPLAAGLRIEIMLRDVTAANSPQISGYHGETAINTSRQLSTVATGGVATAVTAYGFKNPPDVSSSTGIAVGTRCRAINENDPTEFGSIIVTGVATNDGVLTVTVAGGAKQVAGGAIPNGTPTTLQAATGFITEDTPAGGTNGGATLNDQFGQGLSAVPQANAISVIPIVAAQKDSPGSLAIGQSVIGSGARFSAFNQWGLYVGRMVLVSYATAAALYTFNYRRIISVTYNSTTDVYQITLNAPTESNGTANNQILVTLHSVIDVAPTYAVALRNCRIEYPIYRASGESKFQLNVISVRSEQQSGLSTGTSMSLQVASTATQCLACDVLVADEPNGLLSPDQIVSFQPLINGTALLPQPTETQSAQLMRFIDQAYTVASENNALSKSVKSPFTLIARGSRLSRDFPYFAPRMTVPLDNRSLITNRLRIAINRSAAGSANAQYYIFLRVVKSIMFDGSNVTVMA